MKKLGIQKLIYFRDITKGNNAINREYRDYEWMGIMNETWRVTLKNRS